jgi:predicted GIY-YIG superfamily endonuclease
LTPAFEYRASTEFTLGAEFPMRNHRYLSAPPTESLHRLDERFAASIGDLHDRLQVLLRCPPFVFDAKPKKLPLRAVYLFSDGDTPLYIGRTKKLRQRLGNHCRKSSRANQSSFAFQLAREAAGVTERSNSGPTTREELMKDDSFNAGFQASKLRLNAMDIRYVEEPDPVKQALLEIYCAIALETPYNDFDTH